MRLGMLIVENNKVLRETMRENLAYEHPGVIIDMAETVNEAVALLRTATPRGVHYVVVILDIRLPREKGGDDDVHFLRDEVLDWASSETYIFYVSAHLDDPVIQEYKGRLEAQIKNNVQAPRTFFFSRSKSEEVRRFYEMVNQVMHTRRISQKLDAIMPALFGTPGFVPVGAGDMAYVSARDPFTYPGTDPTHRLADLARDIEVHWNYIEGNLKERIRQYFVVTETDTGVDVSLI
jgi:CheY-like chemotaxis protein